MQPVVIIKHRYVIQNIKLCLKTGLKVPPLDALLLQATKETFSHSVISAITFSTHTANFQLFYEPIPTTPHEVDRLQNPGCVAF